MFMLSLLMVVQDAEAGKLADGWRGRAWGDAKSLVSAPDSSCVSNAETGVAWRCQETVAAVPVSVSYVVEENMYTGVVIGCSGFTACRTLLDTLNAAWGTYRTAQYASGALPDGTWRDGDVFASWKYNEFNGEGQVVAMHIGFYKAMKAEQERKARAAAGGL